MLYVSNYLHNSQLKRPCQWEMMAKENNLLLINHGEPVL